MSKQVILTGIRSNGELTLGNYLGAIQPLVSLQKQHAGDYQINMFVPDLHSFITPIDHGQLYQNSLANLRMFTAAGLDLNQPDTYVYRQSYIAAHSELAWILDCFAYFGEVSRMTQFKDKSAGQDNVSVGLFNYPVLMAADILLYGARFIPVGEDQRQHLELARDIAIRMNNRFGKDLFTVPEPWAKQLEFAGQQGSGARIRSLKNPEKKMSKSVSDPSGTILLTDDPALAAKKIMSAATDSVGAIHYDFAAQPGISNLLTIGALLAGRPVAEFAAEWEDKPNYGELKQTVAAIVERHLQKLQAAYQAVDMQHIQDKLAANEAAMTAIANQTLLRVQQVVGLRPHA